MVTLTTSSALGDGGIAIVPASDFNSTRLGPTVTPSRQTVAFDPTAGEGVSATSRRTRAAAGPTTTAPAISAADTTTARRSPTVQPTRQTVPFTPYAIGFDTREAVSRAGSGGHIERTTLIPGSYFRTLEGVAVDTDGKPIGNAKYIMAMRDLPTVGPVADDGTFSVYTLRSDYDDFILVASSGRADVDYTWYTPIDVEIGPTDNDVVLVFEPRELNGLYAGNNTSMGGSLR
ncbi:hypothetical protein [Natrinema gari]|uniref:Uncharacterized protein n=1 Tax=Natrinema gari JCM 14663 TaxID=1230459 RepID=L9Z3T2_9EURY|nr:hypothetical protein [Natrinema gari]ELY81009.1 hypothetical protein C486_07923 [Natrinema gari JCM 14663]